MEYICRICKNTDNLTFLVYLTTCVKLPLFSLIPEIVPSGCLGYHLYFFKEDRYTANLIGVTPPKKFTEEQYNIINQKWNYCVENNLFEYEFEL